MATSAATNSDTTLLHLPSSHSCHTACQIRHRWWLAFWNGILSSIAAQMHTNIWGTAALTDKDTYCDMRQGMQCEVILNKHCDTLHDLPAITPKNGCPCLEKGLILGIQQDLKQMGEGDILYLQMWTFSPGNSTRGPTVTNPEMTNQKQMVSSLLEWHHVLACWTNMQKNLGNSDNYA